MGKISIKLTGKGTIDNAAIFLEDPQEKLPYYLQPQNDLTWTLDDVSIPFGPDDYLDYSLYVIAFSGTKFECEITNTDNTKKIVFSDVTGKIIKNRSISRGSKKFE